MTTTTPVTTFEQAVNEHQDVRPFDFWANTLEGWMPLATFFEEAGDIGQADFYEELVDDVLWLLPDLAFNAEG